MDEIVMNIDEAADFLKCSKSWLYHRLQEQKDVPSHKLGGKIVFCKSELIDWLKKR